MNEEKLIVIGKVLKPHGIKGEAKIKLFSEEKTLLQIGEVLMSKTPEAPVDSYLTIESARFHKKAVLVKFEGFDTPEDVETIRNMVLKVPRSVLPALENDEYFVEDLINVSVFLSDDTLIGSIVNIIDGGSNDIYEIKHPDSGKINLIPARKQFIKSVDLSAGRIVVEQVEGLIERLT